MSAKPDELMGILRKYRHCHVCCIHRDEDITTEQAHTAIRELQGREVLSEEKIIKIVKKLGFIDMTGKYSCFTMKQIKDRPSINDLSHAIHEAMVKKGEGR